METQADEGRDDLRFLKSADTSLLLAPSEDLARRARSASSFLFSCLSPFCPGWPYGRLLVDGFDGEQIWQQIELQTKPLLSSLRRKRKRMEKRLKNHEEISNLFGKHVLAEVRNQDVETQKLVTERVNDVEAGGEEEDADVEELFEEHEDIGVGEEEDMEDDSESGEHVGEEGMITNDDGQGIEDKFFKIMELEEYLEEDENREFGLKKNKNKKKNVDIGTMDDEGSEKNETGEEDTDEDEREDFWNFDVANEGDASDMECARYEDFFLSNKGKSSKKKSKSNNSVSDLPENSKNKLTLSNYEKEREKIRSKIEQLEKANLDPKTWTMQGEVTAAKRPMNSALEVDLDFEHNVPPAPVITEDVTASLEDMIQRRIMAGQFDDVQRAPSLPSKPIREIKELDENKSKKGLAEIYEEEYAQKSGLQPAPMTISDKQKEEVRLLVKKICLRLDALSHFHFAPKPVIEDMNIQANVPALAMEEVAPIAVSDAAMLAPEEVFTGKGDVKEEAELTKAERKRRRANRKRKFKGEAAKRTERNQTEVTGKE